MFVFSLFERRSVDIFKPWKLHIEADGFPLNSVFLKDKLHTCIASRTSLIFLPESSAEDLGMCLPEWASDKAEEPYFFLAKLRQSLLFHAGCI